MRDQQILVSRPCWLRLGVANIKLNLKKLVSEKHSSLFWHFVGDEEKSFMLLPPGPNPIKHLRPHITNSCNKLERLFLASLFSMSNVCE
jgi:hypothetical protein